MKVLLLRGNPRKTGYTRFLTDCFAQGVKEVGADLTDVDIANADMKPCLGCYHCWLSTPGKCIHHDDMGELLPVLQASNAVVCATPLYFYAMSSSLKEFFERTLPVTRHGLADTPKGFLRNRIRNPELWQKKTLVSIIIGALLYPEAFKGAMDTFELIADGMDMSVGGHLVRPESYLLPFRCKPKALKNVELAFIRAGREVGTTGTLTQNTMEMASAPISASSKAFRCYSERYWAHASGMGAAGMVVSDVVPFVARDIQILMQELARAFDPDAAKRVKALIQFDFHDVDLHYSIAISSGRCTMTEAANEQPDLRITCNSEVWAGVFLQELDVRRALTDKLIILEGDKALFSKLPRLFPPPKG